VKKKQASENSPGGGIVNTFFRRANRGLLLDVTVFIINLFLMGFLARKFWDITGAASNGDPIATAALALFFVSMFVLPPAGAVLKRWRYHQRIKENALESSPLAGCLFNPIFYFCTVFVLFAVLDAFVLEYLSPGSDRSAGIFLGSLFFGITVTVAHTWLVYRYFTPPKQPPASAFLRSPAAEIVGDIFIFINMINFQILWNNPAVYRLPHPSGIEEFLGRVLVFGFLALLVYFPPRMFYLADDIGKRRTWLTMLLANSPLLYHVLIGTNSSIIGW
jgi:hypothetical protein